MTEFRRKERRWIAEKEAAGHGRKKACVVVLGATARRRRLHRKGEMLLMPLLLL